uniref:lactose-binding lectin l-2-like n=1 Tax=Styela clava TaxID=7725 RepID=UPI00193A7FE9|nr:lactose-binding lectin l-2-like [Styela clava]
MLGFLKILIVVWSILTTCLSEEFNCSFKTECDGDKCDETAKIKKVLEDYLKRQTFQITCDQFTKLPESDDEKRYTEIEKQMESVIDRLDNMGQLETWYKASNKFYYKIFDDKVDYATAKLNCIKVGAMLSSEGIRDHTIHNQLVPLIKSGKFPVWIGLDDINQENTFVWSNGTVANPRTIPWLFGQPDGGRENDQDCVKTSSDSYFLLNDERCSKKLKYLCEKK